MAKVTPLQEFGWTGEHTLEQPAVLPAPQAPASRRIDLLRFASLRKLIISPWPQFGLRALTLVGFLFTISAALLGPRVGGSNFAIIIVWIAWWTALKLAFIPFGGRSWCSICPVALPGDWLHQGGILQPGKRRLGLGLRWPKFLKGSWLQSGGFLLIGMFSAAILTTPRLTGWVLLALFGLAIGLSLVFERRAFCSYICPIGGFSGIYAKAAPLELKVIDKQICLDHGDKSCYQACPWGIYPLAMKDASACGLCMECLRACPKDNLALNLRPYGSDLAQPSRSSRLDEAFLALVMLGSALAFSAVFLGPWGWLKTSALNIGSTAWVVYVLGFLLLTAAIMPGLFTACVWLQVKISRNSLSLRERIARQAHGLLPLGLMAWIAFTVAFALPKLGYIPAVLADPFGWGWHLLGVSSSGSLDVSSFSPLLQVGLLLVGLTWAARVTARLTARQGEKSVANLPVFVFYAIYTIAMAWLLVG
jgi:polyferredoxin